VIGQDCEVGPVQVAGTQELPETTYPELQEFTAHAENAEKTPLVQVLLCEPEPLAIVHACEVGPVQVATATQELPETTYPELQVLTAHAENAEKTPLVQVLLCEPEPLAIVHACEVGPVQVATATQELPETTYPELQKLTAHAEKAEKTPLVQVLLCVPEPFNIVQICDVGPVQVAPDPDATEKPILVSRLQLLRTE
jgi:hypothetical protein